MSEVTWRLYLDEIVRLRSAAEKQQLYKAVGVTRAAFQRWRNGENAPDASHISLLFKALSEEEREHLRSLMMQDPKIRGLLPTEVTSGRDTPSQLWLLKMLRLQRDSPDRFWQLSGAILGECLTALETHPILTGIELVIATCMPPKNGKVRSLRAAVGRGTSPWRGHLHALDNSFLGMESLPGYVVTKRRGEVIADLSESSLQIQVQEAEYARSAAAFPILMQEHGVAGALLALCTQPDYFTPERMTLLEIFADVIRLALSEDKFTSYDIELGVMPSWTVQCRHFASFRQRVLFEHQKALREESSPLHVEEQILEQIEDELLQIGSAEERIGTHF